MRVFLIFAAIGVFLLARLFVYVRKQQRTNTAKQQQIARQARLSDSQRRLLRSLHFQVFAAPFHRFWWHQSAEKGLLVVRIDAARVAVKFHTLSASPAALQRHGVAALAHAAIRSVLEADMQTTMVVVVSTGKPMVLKIPIVPSAVHQRPQRMFKTAEICFEKPEHLM